MIASQSTTTVRFISQITNVIRVIHPQCDYFVQWPFPADEVRSQYHAACKGGDRQMKLEVMTIIVGSESPLVKIVNLTHRIFFSPLACLFAQHWRARFTRQVFTNHADLPVKTHAQCITGPLARLCSLPWRVYVQNHSPCSLTFPLGHRSSSLYELRLRSLHVE
jgi:hypothetical protein